MIDELMAGFILIGIGYVFFVYHVSFEIREMWKRKKSELIERQHQGENVCLEIIVVDFSMSLVVLFIPILLLVELMFCKQN